VALCTRGQQPSSKRRMRPTWVRELWLSSSGTVSGAGPSGTAPQADGGAAAKLQEEEDGAHSGQRAQACIQWDSEQSRTGGGWGPLQPQLQRALRSHQQPLNSPWFPPGEARGREWEVEEAEGWWRPTTTSSRCQGWSFNTTPGQRETEEQWRLSSLSLLMCSVANQAQLSQSLSNWTMMMTTTMTMITVCN